MVWFLLYWTMALYGLIFTRILQYKTVLKNEPHYQWQLRLTALTAQLKLCTQTYICKQVCSFYNQLHFMVKLTSEFTPQFF